MDSSYLDSLPSERPRHDERPLGMHQGCDCGSEPEPQDPWRKGFTRRRLFQGSSAMVAALGLQTVTTRFAFSASAATNDTDTIIVINCRGGWDSLSIVVPTFEDTLYKKRSNTAIQKSVALPMDGGFGLHPSLKNIYGLYQKGQFAAVHAVGTPDTTLSHFEAMDTLERGTAGGLSYDGYLNRILQYRGDKGVFSAVQFGSSIPLALTGEAPALALQGLQTFGLAGYDDVKAKAVTAFTSLYKGVDHPMTTQVAATFSAITTVEKLKAEKYESAVQYPDTPLANTLKDVAHLVKSKVGLRVATLDVGGFDTHTNEGGADGGDLKNHLDDMDGALGAFTQDLGPEWGNVTIIVVSEFGRTVAENGSNGTDHGHGQAMWVMGGNSINGGKVYGTWPTLADDKLFTNGSLAGTTDYRDVVADVFSRRAGVGSFTKIFPDHKVSSLGITKQRS
jgi:uncharacterized protein (DUF1501 family)